MSLTNASLRTRTQEHFRALQTTITESLEAVENGAARFFEDSWERPGGGGGRSRVLQDREVFEKAGVNFSAVHGEAPGSMSQDGAVQFFATGISLVLHPRSPKIPTVHANFRYFENSRGEAWFGGGMDLTPYYLDAWDARHFHSTIKRVCDAHDPSYYPRFKNWCDEYFYIKHRQEARGIGGIFFDNLSGTAENELERIFEFVQDISESFLPAYLPIVDRHRNESFTESERHWQLLRRGRYVEFNLVYDRGTRFGLETNGRIESILMSLPSIARWDYDVTPLAGSVEAELVDVLKNPRDWVE